MATFSTCRKQVMPDRREPQLDLVPLCGLPLSIAEDILSWVWVQQGDGQLATEATCQVPVGPALGPLLRLNNNYAYLHIY